MKAEQARQLTDQALQRLAEALEAGHSEQLTTYLAAMSKFHSYSFGNVLLIMFQRPDATQVAGYCTWKKLGRFVKKGEKGITIIAPMKIRSKKNTDALSDEEERSFLRFRAVHVFDIAQTDGEPLPEFARVKGDPTEYLDHIKEFIDSKGIALTEVEDLGGAFGVSKGGSIDLLKRQSTAEQFSVLVHELAHELLHHGMEQRPPKTVRETEAEAVAFIVCEAVGLDTNSAAADYIKLYRGDSKTLADSLDRIQRVATEIIAAITPPSTESE